MATKKAKQIIFDRNLKIIQKSISSQNKESPYFKAAFDFPLMNLIKRL